MPHLSLEQKIDRLTGRVDRLEGIVGSVTPRKRGVGASQNLGWLGKIDRFFRSITAAHLTRFWGWFILTLSVLAVFATWQDGQPFNVLLGIGLVVGLWMVVHASNFLGVSETTLRLIQEAHSRNAPSAAAVHHSARTAVRRNGPEQILFTVQLILFLAGAVILAVSYSYLLSSASIDPSWQLFGYLVPALGALAYSLADVRKRAGLIWLSVIAIFILLALGQAPYFALFALLLFTAGMSWYSWSHQKWTLFLGIVIGSYTLLLYWSTSIFNMTPGEYLLSIQSGTDLARLILAVTLVFSLLFSLPFVLRRREAVERISARQIFFVNGLFAILLTAGLGSYLPPQSSTVAAGTLFFLALYFGYVSWIKHGRFSYAKYYLLLAVGMLSVLILLQDDPTLAGLLWFMLAVLLLGFGFVASSYTVRMCGLLLLLLSILYYLLYVLPAATSLAGPVILHERVWMGVIVISFLVVLSSWYRDLSVREPEREYGYLIEQALYAVAFFLTFLLVAAEMAPPAQTIGWVVLGFGSWAWGQRRPFPLLQALGVALSLTGLVKLFLVDTLSWPVGDRFASFVLFGLLLLIGGYLTWRYPHRAMAYLKLTA